MNNFKIIWITNSSENKIIIGDFNCILDKRDRDEGNKTRKRYKCHSTFALSKLIMENELEDLWRRENPDISELTRYNRSSGTRSSIDRVYTDIKIANNTKINHKMISFSDHHNALFIDRLSSKTKIGKDLWHFNNSILQNKDFCSTTKSLLSFLRTKQNNYSSISDWWKYTKSKIKETARSFPKNSTTQENTRISRLKKKLRNLYKKENFKPEIKPLINNLQDELYSLESKQARGAKIRANIRWDLEGEKCSTSFFKILERQHMQNETTSELYTDDKKSKASINPGDILNSAKKIYENLYTKEKVSKSAINELLNKIPINKKTSNEHFRLCEAEISLDEIIEAINSQQNNKCPGNDGLTAEFYKHFSNELAPILLEVYDSWKQVGIIGISSRTGIISVIYKKGDKKDIANYRPISLLNLDYKIFTTILKNRMQQTLEKIIGQNQTAASENRTILHTLSTIRDIIYVSNKLNKNLSVISLDFLKAFDRLGWDFIYLALEKFGYGENFIHLIKVCYNNIQSKIKINGLLSDPFTLSRGVRQGCLRSVFL